MRKTVLGLTAIFLGFGARAVEAAPAWCNVDGLSDYEGTNASDVNNKEWMYALEGIIKNTCNPDKDSKARMKEIDAARAAWSTKLGLVEEDWRDFAEWFVSQRGGIRLYTGEIKVSTDYDKKWAFTAMTPMQQFAAITNGTHGIGSSNYADWNYFADALGPKLSETGRLAYVLRCSDYNVHDDAVLLAMCGPDIKALDRKKVLAEVRADTAATGKMKAMVRVMLWQLDKQLAAYNVAVKKWKDKDAAYGKMFDIAAQVRTEWETIWKNETALLDLVLAMDDARQTSSRKAFEGCSEKTWPAWRAAVAKIPAKKFEGIGTDNDTAATTGWLGPALANVINTPQGYLASVALYTCHKAEADKEPVYGSIGSGIAYIPGFRGPRLATHWTIQSSGFQLDDASARIDYPSARHDTSSRFYTGAGGGGYFGTVQKVSKPDASGNAVVTFAKKSEKQERCLSSRYTKRISQILSNGTVIYETECLKWGVVSVDKTPDPQTVNKRYLDGLKPGMSAYIGGGVVMAVFPKAKKTPIAVAGVLVK
jgi:hypothetical protein